MTTTLLRWPLQLKADGTLAEDPQDSLEEIKRAAGLIADTRVGQLPWAPQYGAPTALGSTNPDAAAAAIEAAVHRTDPRTAGLQVAAAGQDGRQTSFRLATESQ